jgi:hypothetical protein
MSTETNDNGKQVVSTRVTAEVRDLVDRECKLRDHTRSEALEQIINLGLPRYLKTVPVKWQEVNSAA